jgi:hypothetical protein
MLTTSGLFTDALENAGAEVVKVERDTSNTLRYIHQFEWRIVVRKALQ